MVHVEATCTIHLTFLSNHLHFYPTFGVHFNKYSTSMVHVGATCTIPQTTMYKGIEGSHGTRVHVFAHKPFSLMIGYVSRHRCRNIRCHEITPRLPSHRM